jgi:hypothetical protein
LFSTKWFLEDGQAGHGSATLGISDWKKAKDGGGELFCLWELLSDSDGYQPGFLSLLMW